ncbi:hypothetical protein DAPPUDRAFT_307667 [Daphnia pulex]|uniref:Uncharacterized protein n=1 Tax=Daphnia pulex TaxID=6669 RepID=E9H3T9_DAPPU|nr:hypothetical protein DAPPUDRAFT_307667 [Daphnia pulex]|eukprot:EFX73585.1 hypothetical protein DAPPUDRAFT_307667 [Daphnia pulex]
MWCHWKPTPTPEFQSIHNFRLWSPPMSRLQLLRDDPSANSDWVSCSGRLWEEATAMGTVVLMATAVDMGVMGMGMDTTIMAIAMEVTGTEGKEALNIPACPISILLAKFDSPEEDEIPASLDIDWLHT